VNLSRGRVAKLNDKLGGLRKGRSPGRRQTRVAASTPSPAAPDLCGIMEHFTQALSLVVVCQRSLASCELADVGDEEETLRQGIRLLRDVYNEVDLAAGVLDSRGRGSRAARNGEKVPARRGRAARAARAAKKQGRA
jgi:hypothetical protein